MKKLMTTSILVGVLALSAFAQNGRRDDQQQRIGNGVKSGQLTAGETKNLEGKEANLNHEIHSDKAADGGKLTAGQKAQVNRQENHLSRNIYADKHNAATAKYGNNAVGQRRENQQDRIAQGIKSGSLRPGEAAHLENRESNINHEVAADRAGNGGKLTTGERAQVNRQQNGASRAIRKDKTNGKTGY